MQTPSEPKAARPACDRVPLRLQALAQARLARACEIDPANPLPVVGVTARLDRMLRLSQRFAGSHAYDR